MGRRPRSALINGPTVDYRGFFSGRGVATNYISPADDAAFVASFGLQFDHPAGFAGQAPFPGAAPSAAAGWTNTPTSYSPAKEMRLRVLDFGVDKYGLNAYIYDSTNDGEVNYDKVLFSPDQRRANAVADAEAGPVGRCQGQDRRRCAGRHDRRHAGQGRRADRPTSRRCACSTPPSPAPTPAGPTGRRTRFHRRFRRVCRPEIPHIHRGGLCNSRGWHRQRGDLCGTGAVLGKGASPADHLHPARNTSPTW